MIQGGAKYDIHSFIHSFTFHGSLHGWKASGYRNSQDNRTNPIPPMRKMNLRAEIFLK
jgi:hypothetical protein